MACTNQSELASQEAAKPDTNTPVIIEETLESSPSPEFTPEPTECVPNPEWRDTYTIQPNDTLGAIAIAAGVTIKDMEEGNCITDRDRLFVGQVLQVPNAFSINLASSPEGLAGVMLFVREDALWVVRSDGTAPRQVTLDMTIIGQPVRSPDLENVVFRAVSQFYDSDVDSEIPPPTDLWFVQANGNGLRNLVDQAPRSHIYRSMPTWSPDNTKVAFIEQEHDVGSLVVINTDGTNRIVVTTGDFVPPNEFLPIAPAWSLDGRKLAYVVWDKNDIASLQTVSPQARAEDGEIHASNFHYIEGPYWLRNPFNQSTLAYAVFSEIQQLEWHTINTNAGRDSIITTIGLAHPNADLSWIFEIRGDGLNLISDSTPTAIQLPPNIASITWGTEGVQFVVSQGENGMLLVDIENDIQQSITRENDLFPVWSPQIWVSVP